jgi:hypothetical protein
LHPSGCFDIVSLTQPFSQLVSDVDCRRDHVVGGAKKDVVTGMGGGGAGLHRGFI